MEIETKWKGKYSQFSNGLHADWLFMNTGIHKLPDNCTKRESNAFYGDYTTIWAFNEKKNYIGEIQNLNLSTKLVKKSALSTFILYYQFVNKYLRTEYYCPNFLTILIINSILSNKK